MFFLKQNTKYKTLLLSFMIYRTSPLTVGSSVIWTTKSVNWGQNKKKQVSAIIITLVKVEVFIDGTVKPQLYWPTGTGLSLQVIKSLDDQKYEY